MKPKKGKCKLKIFAIDPGTTQSAWVLYADGKPKAFGIEDNSLLAARISCFHPTSSHPDIILIEMIASYGMAVGASVFETCVWIGRFMQAIQMDIRCERVFRKDVKMHLCNSTRAKDANIRQAVMDRYGSSREVAIGKKKSPGPLYGVSKDVWAALSIAIYWDEKNRNIH